MYSPKIPERLIPALYRLARSRRQPMTRLVAEVLDAYLREEGGGVTAPAGRPAVPIATERGTQ